MPRLPGSLRRLSLNALHCSPLSPPALKCISARAARAQVLLRSAAQLREGDIAASIERLGLHHGATGGAARHTGRATRSKAEVMFAAHWLAAYGDVSLKTLKDALARGHAMGLVDAVFSICYGVDVAVDYDDGYYHDPGAIPRDVRKTERMLLHPAMRYRHDRGTAQGMRRGTAGGTR